MSILRLRCRMPQVRSPELATGFEFFALDFIGLARLYGRDAEQHSVTTEDGYKLSVFRLLPHSASNESVRRRVIFIQHALLTTSDTFILLGPPKSLALQLSDAGYDVWLGNFRGNTYCRKHQTLSAKDPKFWDFSVDEIALMDLPAMLDYVIEATGEPRISYIGYSFGTITMLMLLSEKPEYNSKVHPAIFFGPVAYWRANTPLTYVLSFLVSALPVLARPMTEMFYQNTLLPRLYKHIFSKTAATSIIFKFPLYFFLGKGSKNFDHEFLTKFFCYYPAGTSVKCLEHLGQHVKTGNFQRYDHGSVDLNRKHYGQDAPLPYDVSRITAGIVIFRGQNDAFTPPRNVKELIQRLPSDSLLLDYVIPDSQFTHGDFMYGRNVCHLVNDKVLDVLREFD